MGGLDSETSGGQEATQPPGQSPAQQFAPTQPAQTPATHPTESHLDTFFNGSGWTREDVMLLAQIASLVILLYWATTEVNA